MDAPLITTFIAVALVLVYIIAIGLALEAIMKARTSQGAVAWTISLLTLPYITVPLYLVFGRNKFDGYLEKRNEIEEAIPAPDPADQRRHRRPYRPGVHGIPRCTPAC